MQVLIVNINNLGFLGHFDSALPAHLFPLLSHEKSSNIQVVPLTFLL